MKAKTDSSKAVKNSPAIKTAGLEVAYKGRLPIAIKKKPAEIPAIDEFLREGMLLKIQEITMHEYYFFCEKSSWIMPNGNPIDWKTGLFSFHRQKEKRQSFQIQVNPAVAAREKEVEGRFAIADMFNNNADFMRELGNRYIDIYNTLKRHYSMADGNDFMLCVNNFLKLPIATIKAMLDKFYRVSTDKAYGMGSEIKWQENLTVGVK
jgi:hypothetical protein